MMILAIDPATQLGWAFRNAKGTIKHGTESFHNNQWDGAGVRYLKFNAWLEDQPRPELIVYEEVHGHTGTFASHIYGGWVSTLQSFGERYEIPYTSVGVRTVKKFWTGHGNANKSEMIRACRERGFNPQDDNAADALAILHWAIEAFTSGELKESE